MRAAPPDRRIVPAIRFVALGLFLLVATARMSPLAAQDLGPLPELGRQGTIDRTQEGLVRVAWDLPDAPVYPGQVVSVGLVAELDEDFLANRMVQPFTRRLDVPLAFDDPAIDLERVVDFGVTILDGPRVAFGERIVRAFETKSAETDDGARRRLRVEARVRANVPGEVRLPAPIARFASADEFREELLGRTPVDARLAVVRGTPATLSVQAFPESGRAPDFDGLLGRYALRVEAQPRELHLGDVLHLSLHVDGPLTENTGGLPRLDDLRGLHLVSRRTTNTPDGVRVDAELRVERAVREIPEIALHSFDPERASYVVAHSKALPLVVLASEPVVEAESSSSRVIWLSLAAALVIAVLLGARRRRGERAREA